jgi:hypothetical protein
MSEQTPAHMAAVNGCTRMEDLPALIELLEDNYVRQLKAVAREIEACRARGSEPPESLTQSRADFLSWLNPDALRERARGRIERNQRREERRQRRKTQARRTANRIAAELNGSGPPKAQLQRTERKEHQQERSAVDLERRRSTIASTFAPRG